MAFELALADQVFNEKDILKEVERMRIRIRQQNPPFTNDTLEKQRKRIERATKPTLDGFDYFCNTYFPDSFRSKRGEFQKEIEQNFLSNNGEIIIYIGPREHGKTMRWTTALEVWVIVTDQRHFIINLSETQEQAVMMMNLNVRGQLEFNERIIKDFGTHVNPGNWGQDRFITKYGQVILARGRKQSGRGLVLQDGQRPDFVRVDDISSDDSSRNKLLEGQMKDKILGEYYGALGSDDREAKIRKTGTILWTGNWIRKTSCIAQAWKESQTPGNNRIAIKQAACDFNTGWVLWPERYDIEYFAKIKRDIGRRPFDKEYLNLDTDGEKFFWRDKFIPFSLDDAEDYIRAMQRMIIVVDPSFGKTKRTAKTKGASKRVALVMGIDPKRGFFLFDGLQQQGGSPHIFWDGLIDLFKAWNSVRPIVIHYEGNARQKDDVAKEIDMAGQRKGIMPIARKAFMTATNKHDRIQHISPYCDQDKLYYCIDIPICRDVIDDAVLYEGEGSLDYYDLIDDYAMGICQLEAPSYEGLTGSAGKKRHFASSVQRGIWR